MTGWPPSNRCRRLSTRLSARLRSARASWANGCARPERCSGGCPVNDLPHSSDRQLLDRIRHALMRTDLAENFPDRSGGFEVTDEALKAIAHDIVELRDRSRRRALRDAEVGALRIRWPTRGAVEEAGRSRRSARPGGSVARVRGRLTRGAACPGARAHRSDRPPRSRIGSGAGVLRARPPRPVAAAEGRGTADDREQRPRVRAGSHRLSHRRPLRGDRKPHGPRSAGTPAPEAIVDLVSIGNQTLSTFVRRGTRRSTSCGGRVPLVNIP